MKRIGISFALPILGLLVGVATPATASAQGWRGGGHAAPMATGGWRGGAVTRPMGVSHVAVAPRAYVGRPVGGNSGAWARPGYVRPAYGYRLGPVAGHWGFHGPTRVWFGASTLCPYPGWIWTPGTWVWNGDQWAWQDGNWSPPVY